MGGSCLNKDPFILKAVLRKRSLSLRMVYAAAEVNRSIPKHIADLVMEFSKSRKKVVIADVAFNRDTDDIRLTLTFGIAGYLRSGGFEVELTDPFVQIPDITIDHDIYESSIDSEILILLTDQSEYKALDLERLRSIMPGTPLVIDNRGPISRDHAVDLCFEYHGYGRL